MMQKTLGGNYSSAIEYAYKLLLKNQAHDGICGCSTDDVHQENMIRYKKVLQIADTILKELHFLYKEKFYEKFKSYYKRYSKIAEFEYVVVPEGCEITGKHAGFDDKILYDTQRIPITEDYTTVYRYLKAINFDENDGSPMGVLREIFRIDGNKIRLINGVEIDFVRYVDIGDTYNFGAVAGDKPEIAQILGSETIMNGKLRAGIKIKTSFFDVKLYLDRGSNLLRFKIEWDNKYKNKLWQVRFTAKKPVFQTYSEDMNSLIVRNFDPDYNIREHLPKAKGIEAKTNTAPMQRYVGTKDFGIITKGINEYEVYKNTISLTLLRSVGIISNPENPSRSTPAGPPIEVPEAQQLGYNIAEFAVGFFEPELYDNYIKEYLSSNL